MLAYIFWHRPAEGVEQAAYEQALERFHRSLAHRPPSGLCCSAAMRLSELPWAPVGTERGSGHETGPGPQLVGAGVAYEDWYVVEDWSALGVLEEAAVSRGHLSAHDAIASRTGNGAGAVYRLIEGVARPADRAIGVWVSSVPGGHERLSLQALLGDGIDPARDGLWQRSLVLGPAPEYCLLADDPPAGVAATRLPEGWSVRAVSRTPIWQG